ncbi:MAG: glycosyltransferase family 9 protein [Candidatus Algichlamydia australiensis]|nr:glycosyltransferase family 9 protein [Chlamydiales bacterium]
MRLLGNPLDRLLRKAKKKSEKNFLFLWNRGLGDIPLGLYALGVRVREFVLDAKITYLTRPDLADCFQMLPDVEVAIAPSMRRGESKPIEEWAREAGISIDDYDHVLEKIDPTRWLSWQLGKLVPRLFWNPKLDALSKKFSVKEGAVGVHVQSETKQFYGYTKDWPEEYWQELFARFPEKQFVLFGMSKSPIYQGKNIVDLRGETTLHEMLSLIKNCCSIVIAPDSGILSTLYYINEPFSLRLISLWADPRQGVLRQNVHPPNPYLDHIPLIGKDEIVANINVDDLASYLT